MEQQNNFILSMLDQLTQEKEEKLKKKNDNLLRRIRQLEKKKKILAGESVHSSHSSFLEEQNPSDNEDNQNYQDLLNSQAINDGIALPPPPYQQTGLEKQLEEESIFQLADSLQPGTKVKLVKYGRDRERLYYDMEPKVASIKDRLRQKVGDFGYDNGLSLKDRVRLKLQNQQPWVVDDEGRKYSKGAFLDSQTSNGQRLGTGSSQRIDGDSAVIPFLKFGKADHLFAHINKNVPQADVGDLVKDFRIDEEYGMPRDNNLENFEANKDRLDLQDNMIRMMGMKQGEQKEDLSPLKQSQNYRDNDIAIIQKLSTMDMLLKAEKEENKIIEMVDQNYPVQDEAKQWMMQVIRSFLLKIVSDGTWDYSLLLPKRQNARDGSEEFVPQEQLEEKFRYRLRQLLACFSTEKRDSYQPPSQVMHFLKALTEEPPKNLLTLFEVNRLQLGDMDNTYTQHPKVTDFRVEEDIEKTMLIGMFLLGKIMAVKLLLKTSSSGLGLSLSLVQKRNLKLFASVVYHSLHSFILKSLKVKRKDFRSDDDLISKALFDKYEVRKALKDPLLENTIEQTIVEWINRIMYLLQQ